MVIKQGRLIVSVGQPLQFTDVLEGDRPDVKASKLQLTIGNTLKAYRETAEKLLTGKYAAQKELAPRHLREACNTLVIGCDDGVFVRYDLDTTGNPRIRCAVMKASLAEIAPQFSDHFVHFPNDTRNYVPTNFGPEITLTKSNIETGYSQELGRGHVAVCSTTALPVDFQMPAPSARPPCLLSVQNELEWEIQGIVVSADTPEHLLTPDYPGAQHFLGYSRVRLPVGWERIDVYPALADEYWKPEYASAWAELDILAEIVRRNSLELMLHGIDGRLATRQHYANLLREFQSLLQGPEEPAHQFLKKHPGLLCPTHDRMWSKLPFGDNVSDFVFREPHNDYRASAWAQRRPYPLGKYIPLTDAE